MIPASQKYQGWDGVTDRQGLRTRLGSQFGDLGKTHAAEVRLLNLSVQN